MRRSYPHLGEPRNKFDTGLGDRDLQSDGVLYSLKKHGRWALPEVIKQNILSGDHSDEDFGIQLVERHKISKNANCISICTSKAQPGRGAQQVGTKRGGYLNVKSFLGRKPRYSRRERRDRRRRGLPVNTEQDEEEAEPTQVRYEVLYPAPAHSSLTHNPKYVRYDTGGPYGWDYYATRRRGNRHRKRMCKQLLQEAFSLMDDEVEDSEEETVSHGSEDVSCNRSPVTLEDILEQTREVGKLVSMPTKFRRYSEEERRSAEVRETKGRVVHIDKEDKQSNKSSEPVTTTQPTQTTTKTTTMEPVIVVLPFEQITPNALRDRFGPSYLESECFPRKFVLDISEQVSRMDKFKGYLRNERTVNACLVFTVDDKNEMNTVKDSICKIILNTNFCDDMESVKIETIFDYMDTHLDEVINRTMFFIETLPDDVIIQNQQNPAYRVRQNNRSTVAEFARWSNGAYKVDDEFLLKYFTGFDKRCDDATDLGFEVVSYFESVDDAGDRAVASGDDNFCGICYDMIDDQTSATALVSCGHWFCDNCWRDHLKTKVSTGAHTLPCPEYDCGSTVDPGTALSFVCMPQITRLAKRRHDTEVERLDETRWCPNERCGRVLKVNSTNVRLAKCLCGQECCFDCLGPPHWPANCKSVMRFQKTMSARGDSSILPVEAAVGVIVNGKNCPHCHKFVEKDGGCPYMMCICGKAFCWGCGRAYDALTIHSNCYKFGYNDKHGTMERNIDPEDKLSKLKRRRWYKLALTHRIGQHPVKYQNMRTASRKLTKKIRELLAQAEKKNSPICLEFQMEGKTYTREADKTSDFLASMIELYREASRLVENMAVILDDEDVATGKTNSSLRFMAVRLSTFVDAIYDLFVKEGERNVADTLSRMKQVRRHSRNIIRALVNHITHRAD